MIFSSVSFIYYFLPILLFTYFIVPRKYKNMILLVFSLVFYFLGEPKYIWVLLLSCIVNYYCGNKIYEKKHSKLVLIMGLSYNILQLLYFKYVDFFIDNINKVFNGNINFLYIVMPIGISFFTFQAISYLVDIYREKQKPASNLLDFMMYISFFAQLVAGPIVRYSDIDASLKKRESSFDNVAVGIRRFVIGLAKKVLMANVLGELCEQLSGDCIVASWVRPILFTLQIYYDFSGYSDMAIGLGRMFGFKFLENFNYPLIASSITDFWRRWHISLSSWFRDYVYIPLGGNKVSFLLWIRNNFIVWFLTGFWHGASWNFIIWGLYFGVVLVIEKVFLKKFLDKTKIVKYIYTLLLIVISFLIFSTDSISNIADSLGVMFFFKKEAFINYETMYILKSNLIFLFISVVGVTPIVKVISEKVSKQKVIGDCLEVVTIMVLLILCTAFLIDESFNPFLYFRF